MQSHGTQTVRKWPLHVRLRPTRDEEGSAITSQDHSAAVALAANAEYICALKREAGNPRS